MLFLLIGFSLISSPTALTLPFLGGMGEERLVFWGSCGHCRVLGVTNLDLIFFCLLMLALEALSLSALLLRLAQYLEEVAVTRCCLSKSSVLGLTVTLKSEKRE